MASAMKYLFPGISIVVLLSTAYSVSEQCKCVLDLLIRCAQCSVGCTTLGKDCLPCPDNCFDCMELTLCSDCDPGHWGEICENNCSSGHCKSNKCSKETGRCLYGCAEGYFGIENPPKTCVKCPTTCLTCTSQRHCDTCVAGYSGRACQSRCDKCVDSQCCMSRCTRDCVSGYFPSLHSYVEPCLKCPDSCRTCTSLSECLTCKSGFYGRVCQFTCDRCKNRICNKAGCLEGCAEGYQRCVKCHGDGCQPSCCQVITSPFTCTVKNCRECKAIQSNKCKICKEGFFQTNEDKCNMCSEGCRGGNCEMSSGRCIDGCKNGWTGDKCEVECSKDICIAGGAEQSGKRSQDTTVIVSSIVGGVVFVLILISVAIVVTVRRKRLRMPSSVNQSISDEAPEGTQQYEDLGARNEHIYMHEIAEGTQQCEDIGA